MAALKVIMTRSERTYYEHGDSGVRDDGAGPKMGLVDDDVTSSTSAPFFISSLLSSRFFSFSSLDFSPRPCIERQCRDCRQG